MEETTNFKEHPRGVSLIEILICFGIVSVVLGIMLPGILSTRESARLIHCRNNLHQLGVAMNDNETAATFFEIRDRIDASDASVETVVDVLQCPSDVNTGTFRLDEKTPTYGRANYAGVTGDGTASGFYTARYERVLPSFPGPELAGAAFRDCTDGLSNTFHIGEQDSAPADPLATWRYMAGATGKERPNSKHGGEKSTDAFRSQHDGGVNFLLGDGAVRFIGDTISIEVYRAMMTISAGEVESQF